jgi:tetratricopeptide (TPR) repeat protein
VSEERGKRRWLKRSLWATAILVACFAAFLVWVRLACFAEPPALGYRPAILDAAAPVEADGRVRYGGCWFEERRGHSLLYVEGDPYSIGYANARLSSRLLEAQERAFLDTIRGFYPSRLALFGIGLVVLVNNRNLPDYVPPEYREEIRGIAEGMEDPFPGYGPRYHRILNYHAAHDISHWVLDKPVIGCTAFAARGGATAGGRLLVGRNFDFEGGRCFDEGKLILCCRPRTGKAFLSVSWPGMAGAVTGLNEDRLYCSINGAHSSDRDNIGTPVSIVVRQVLQHASSLEDAARIIREAEVFVSDSYLVADGRTGEALVVEKSPGRVAVRRIEGDVLLQANHFETPDFAADEGNLEYQRVGTSLSRRARLAELVGRAPLDAPAAAAILRDRSAAGGRPLALGNRSAIDAMISTHSVIADVTRGILWVSRGPHQLGAYDAYAIDGFGAPPAPPIPQDAALADGSYGRLLRARERIGSARADLERGDPGRAVEALAEALRENPGDADALALLGDALEAKGETRKALDAFRQALAASPAFPGERARIESAIARLG